MVLENLVFYELLQELWNPHHEIFRDILAGKLKVVLKTRRWDSDTEIEGKEEDSDFEIFVTSEKEVLEPIKIHIEEKLQILPTARWIPVR